MTLRLALCLLLCSLTGWASVTQAQTPVPDVPASGLTIHVVQRGETLFRIALRYGTTTDELARLNGLTNVALLLVGERLLVPVAGAENPALNPERPSPATPAAADEAGLHTVAPGETLFSIAQRYNLSVNDLAAANNLSNVALIFAGQQLLVPSLSAAPAPPVLPPPLTEFALKPERFVEGETGSIRFTTAVPLTAIAGTFLGSDLRIISDTDSMHHSILVGVPVYTAAGSYPLTLTMTSGDGTKASYTHEVRVLAGGYGAQTLTLSPDLAPLLSQAPQDYELDLLRRLTSTFTAERYYEGPFGLPAAAAMNSPFGTRRSYNDSLYTGYHTGADFASAPGAPVFAVAPGRVILADLLNIRGNTVILDHGWGVFSVYSHQSQINVQLAQFVATGQIIGAAGATGRITGPHLHWEVWVNGVAVNPLQWTHEAFP